MLDYPTISDIALRAAWGTLGQENVSRAFTGYMTDAEGNEALKVTLVVPPNMPDHVEGRALIQTLMKINKGLREKGEDRQSVIYYATEEDMATKWKPRTLNICSNGPSGRLHQRVAFRDRPIYGEPYPMPIIRSFTR